MTGQRTARATGRAADGLGTAAYPVGRLADRWSRPRLLAIGLAVLTVADLVLASADTWPTVFVGVGLWGLHMGMTQGLVSAMIADAAPGDLRGTAFGILSLLCGLAMLAASALAGLLWDRLGAAATFQAGAIFCALALVAMRLPRRRRSAGKDLAGA